MIEATQRALPVRVLSGGLGALPAAQQRQCRRDVGARPGQVRPQQRERIVVLRKPALRRVTGLEAGSQAARGECPRLCRAAGAPRQGRRTRPRVLGPGYVRAGELRRNGRRQCSLRIVSRRDIPPHAAGDALPRLPRGEVIRQLGKEPTPFCPGVRCRLRSQVLLPPSLVDQSGRCTAAAQRGRMSSPVHPSERAAPFPRLPCSCPLLCARALRRPIPARSRLGSFTGRFPPSTVGVACFDYAAPKFGGGCLLPGTAGSETAPRAWLPRMSVGVGAGSYGRSTPSRAWPRPGAG